MAECRNVVGIVVADFVAGGADCGHKIRMTSRAVADEKESGLAVVAVQGVEEVGRGRGERGIAEPKGNEREARAEGGEKVLRGAVKRRGQPKGAGPRNEDGGQR